MPGKFIVLYASNNLGKSEQIIRLSKALLKKSNELLVLKYPLYNLKPTGPIINRHLRSNTKISEQKLQEIYAQNRKDFQPTLKSVLRSGISVLAEDYTGTGMAWGLTRGVSIKKLEQINSGLLEPDVAVLLDGERFTTKIESNHRNEGDDQKVWDKNRKSHVFLAKRYGWSIVNANQSIKQVHKDIIKCVVG